MLSHPLPTAITQHSRLITAAFFCLCCAGCIDDRASIPDVSVQKAATDGQIDQARPGTASPPPPAMPPLPKPGSSTATINRAISSLEYLQSESGLMFRGGISSKAVGDLLRSSRSTSNAIDRMTQDAASSPEAQDLTRHYRSSLARAIGQDGVLESLSCGLSLCIGIVRARSNADHEAWGLRLASDSSSPTYSYAEASENLGAVYENRFIFSTDPAMNSISGN